nr:immunoglobulin light chain junction region [Macaca mulatta]
CHQYKNWITF